ncbi:MAG TPA: folylpolyglutamate synthase/dihydrofolate synthase family protein [Capsulimonadaceae bacterium]|nr:folylpolyglutamate synthase/dihydrofolate synthase family protein [Capsulimonadaceae bacterium]
MDFDDSVAYMRGLLRLGIKLGNERFTALLERLGNPHEKLNAVHIAGTKGKGSTTAMAASILQAAGYKTGAYFSPFVYDIRERVQIDGRMIPKGDFARLVTLIRPHIEALALTEHGQTTEFELKTAVGLCYFAEQNVDYAVVEVGIGGRLDATNVLPHPKVSVITNIGFDHMEMLGDTLGAIAGEKAGIIKENGLCVTGIEGGEALDVVAKVCRERNARLVRVRAGREWVSQGHRLTIRTERRCLESVTLGLRGAFQQANSALAVTALDEAEIPGLSDQAVRRGLAQAFAPGRLELIRAANPTIVADGAHNELAGRVLGDALAAEYGARDRAVILVVGMTRSHSAESFLQALLKSFHPVALVATEPSFRPAPAEEVVAAAKAQGIERVEAATPAREAARRAVTLAKDYPDALIVASGSFYTVGDIPPAVWEALSVSPHNAGGKKAPSGE